MYSIYVLRCPETNEVKYVGRTKNKLSIRILHHVNQSSGLVNEKDKWIQYLLSRDLYPIIEKIDEAKINNGAKKERKWIRYYRKINGSLFNKRLPSLKEDLRTEEFFRDQGRNKIDDALKKHRVTVFVEWDKIVARGGMKAMKKHLTSQA